MADGNRLTVAAAQIESSLGDVAANLEKHLAFIGDARAAGADIVLFPEMSLTGHSAGPDTLRLALRADDPMVMAIAERAGPVYVTFGLIEEGRAAQFYNSAITVRNGGTVYIHRKVNLATYGQLDDAKHFAVGRFIDSFTVTDCWQASVLICADLWNPALVHLAALHGATVLLAPISSAGEAVGLEFDNPRGWELALQFYGMIYGMPLVIANRIGKEGGLTFWGGSRIVDAWGHLVAAATGPTEQLVVGAIDFDQVRLARFRLPTVRDSNLALMLREAQRLSEILGVPELGRRP